MNEEGWVLVGRQRGGVWRVRRVWRAPGAPASVEFDWRRALAREESRGDVMGFMHTHPGFSLRPSARDGRTMDAWCSCFGKPLLCAIASGDAIRAWVYPGAREVCVERFRNGWLTAVDG